LFDDATYELYLLVMGNQVILGATRPGRPASGTPLRGQRAASGNLVERSALLFGLLADPTRLRLLRLLATRPHYGQELASALSISGATTTHHTNELIRAGFVTIERRARRTYFVLRTASLAHELRESLDFLLAADQPEATDEVRGLDKPSDERVHAR
jgi:DNA-binding transcriptional ArsR family regulator